MNAVLEECGCAPQPEDAIVAMVGDGAAMLVARAFEVARCPQPQDALERFLRIYDSRLLRFTRPYEGIPALLEALARRGVLAVLTNKPIAATRRILDGLDLAPYFGDRVLGGDGPHPRKPDPGGLLQLAEAASVPLSETMMVGDSAVDFETARRAGARACLARYGFGYHEVALGDLRHSDLLIERPLDLLFFL